MFLFELDKSLLNRSLVSSMEFIYHTADEDLKKWTDIVPFDVPFV